VNAEDLEFEIVVVDDASTDGTADAIREFKAEFPELVTLRHDRNRGKGAAVRSAIAAATGEIGVIQDADLEYNPQEIPLLIRPILEGNADAVYGSRFASSGERRVLYFWHSLANRFLTTICNAVADLNLTDMGTGYKAFRLTLMKSIPLRSDGFAVEPEITIKLAQRKVAIYEVPISYRGRTYAEGKKIRVRDALKILFAIPAFGIRRDIYTDHGAQILDALSQTNQFNRWMADTIRKYVGSQVLEIGAGIGNLSQHLAARRKTYIATDIDDEHLARLRVRFHQRPNVILRKCDLSCPADFADLKERADTVVCLNVLEHIEDDATGLGNIHSALKPGGTAIVLVPQGQKIYGTLDEVLGHFRRYSEQELRKKMEAAGLHVERVLHFNRITMPGWYLNGRILKRKSFGRFQLFIFDHLVWLWKILDRLIPWMSVSIIGIAKKSA
jgi:2-polyprenyl-3-methyl-5-hydroxy-6-metoxy-1,4-benzoquinol methylase